jgi:post-segregation antitoxin (ccd killing protein)
MTLNADLLRRARGLSGDISEVVEGLLAAYVESAERERAVAAHIAASGAFVARHGSLADEFDTL